VVSATIDKYIYVILNQRFDKKIYLSYSKKEIVDSVAEIQHELVREAMRMTGVTEGVEIAIMADIPSEGSGLGSSSSLTGGLLNAFYAYQGIQAPAQRLAEEACRIEIDICRKPIGKQDQYIAAYGGLRFFEFMPDESVREMRFPLGKEKQDLGDRLMLYFTNLTRKADVILKEQTENSSSRRDYLDLIRDLAYSARDVIMAGDYDRVGDILRENWRLKKTLADGITNPTIERMVELAMNGGALGCKISGAGGGGCLLPYCRPHKKGELRDALRDYREMPFFIERYGSKVIFNVEGYEWK